MVVHQFFPVATQGIAPKTKQSLWKVTILRRLNVSIHAEVKNFFCMFWLSSFIEMNGRPFWTPWGLIHGYYPYKFLHSKRLRAYLCGDRAALPWEGMVSSEQEGVLVWLL